MLVFLEAKYIFFLNVFLEAKYAGLVYQVGMYFDYIKEIRIIKRQKGNSHEFVKFLCVDL